MPLGTAQETSTPSRSRRKSQCRRRAWCSWTTNLGCLVLGVLVAALGSGVCSKLRLALYSFSLPIATKVSEYAVVKLLVFGAAALLVSIACGQVQAASRGAPMHEGAVIAL